MGRVTIKSGDVDNNSRRLLVFYRDSDLFDSSLFIHKYYLAPEDKGKLFPVDIRALEVLSCSGVEYGLEGNLDLWRSIIPEQLPDVTIYYQDLKLEKTVDANLVRRGLQAIAAYRRDILRDATPEEARAALQLNDWLRNYEKTLAAKYLDLENGLKHGLSGADPFLVDYEIALEMKFYLREDDPYFDNEAANEHDWDMDAGLMCNLKYLFTPSCLKEFDDPDYFGIGDNQDHNDAHGRSRTDPVLHARHCMLFHELTSHHGVPIRHLKRIGRIWTDIKVQYQTAVEIDLSAEIIGARQVETYTGKLREEVQH